MTFARKRMCPIYAKLSSIHSSQGLEPWQVCADLGEDVGVLFSARHAKGHEANLIDLALSAGQDQRASGVAVTSSMAARLRANLVFGNALFIVFDIRIIACGSADGVAVHKVQLLRLWTWRKASVAPAVDRNVGAGVNLLALVQVDGLDGVGKFKRRGEAKQSDVVDALDRVKVLVGDAFRDVALDATLLDRVGASDDGQRPRDKVYEAVAGGENPLGANEAASADVRAVFSDTDNVWSATVAGHLATNDGGHGGRKLSA